VASPGLRVAGRTTAFAGLSRHQARGFRLNAIRARSACCEARSEAMTIAITTAWRTSTPARTFRVVPRFPSTNRPPMGMSLSRDPTRKTSVESRVDEESRNDRPPDPSHHPGEFLVGDEAADQIVPVGSPNIVIATTTLRPSPQFPKRVVGRRLSGRVASDPTCIALSVACCASQELPLPHCRKPPHWPWPTALRIEPLRRQRPGREAVQGSLHPFQRRLHGRLTGAVVQL